LTLASSRIIKTIHSHEALTGSFLCYGELNT